MVQPFCNRSLGLNSAGSPRAATGLIGKSSSKGDVRSNGPDGKTSQAKFDGGKPSSNCLIFWTLAIFLIWEKLAMLPRSNRNFKPLSHND